MDQIKEAFQKVKQEMNHLIIEVESLKLNLAEINWRISKLTEEVKDLKKPPQRPPYLLNLPRTKPINLSTQGSKFQTHSTHPSTDNASFEPLKHQNLGISTGNEGVPTDRQTHQQTDRHIENDLINSFQQPPKQYQSPFQSSPDLSFNLPESTLQKTQERIIQGSYNPLQNAAQILDSLDALKKEIRLKFKRLTEKEILVFSALSQLEEQEGYTDYRSLAKKLNLTESSIRDYIKRLVDKGIPVEKNKINNKTIQLKISDSLKKIASLATILQLRDI